MSASLPVYHLCDLSELDGDAPTWRKFSNQRVELARLVERHTAAAPLRQSIEQLALLAALPAAARIADELSELV